MTSDDHLRLRQQFLQLAGDLWVLAQDTGINELCGMSLVLIDISNIHLEASLELARKERFVNMRNFFIGLLVVALLLIGVVAIAAQDSTSEPTPVSTLVPTLPDAPPATDPLPDQTETPEDIIGIVLAALFGGAASIGGTFVVTSVVGILKLFIPASVASGDVLKNIVSLVVWLAYSIAIKFGLGGDFQNVAAILAPILTTAIPLIATLLGSRQLFLGARNAKIPILGYERTPAAPAFVRSGT